MVLIKTHQAKHICVAELGSDFFIYYQITVFNNIFHMFNEMYWC